MGSPMSLSPAAGELGTATPLRLGGDGETHRCSPCCAGNPRLAKAGPVPALSWDYG